MAGNVFRKVPRFYGFRIYISAGILYYFLVLPFLLILTIKNAPQLYQYGKLQDPGRTEPSYSNRQLRDSLQPIIDSMRNIGITLPGAKADSMIRSDADSASEITIKPGQVIVKNPGAQEKEESKTILNSFSLLFFLQLMTLALGFVFNFPFKRYFRKKRKKRVIPEKLSLFCRKWLLRSPWINTAIVFLSYGIVHMYMIFRLNTASAFPTTLEHNLFRQFFYVSLIATALALLLVYFWEKHRVHLLYLEHVFSEEELKVRIFKRRIWKIRDRFWISSAMTTLLPLTIVMLYLYLGMTPMREIRDLTFNADETKILFGDYLMLDGMFEVDNAEPPGFLFYYNVINSFLMIVGIYSGIVISFIYILLFIKWTTQGIVHPVNELLKNIEQTGKDDVFSYTIVRNNDEIGILTEGYNQMNQRLSNYISHISQMTHAYSRFVPRQFLDYLGKMNYVDIKLGDQVQKEMTVLFSDIRSFTEISEQMTPKENFDFINHYLGYMEPVIRNNNGFIDKYMGDGILALFSDKPEDAINASIEMRFRLSQFNQVMKQLNRPNINNGVGMHTGMLMLGIVGGQERLSGTVISDAVNLASRLEGLTKLFGSSVIISQDTLFRIQDPEKYSMRYLGVMHVKGKAKEVNIYEVIDADPEDVRGIKLNTRQQFEEAIRFYREGNIKEAYRSFSDVSERNKNDKASEIYLNSCMQLMKSGIPEDWDGTRLLVY